MKKILLLSAYDAASHKYWRQLVSEELPEFEWNHVALPAKHFSFRTRGNSFIFAYQYRQQLLEKKYDLIIATSMVDLASLRGFLPELAQIPTIVYFHENQFVYPVSKQQPNIVNAQLTSIYTLLCADQVVFNSHYNLQTYFDGAIELLKKMPERLPVESLQLARQQAKVLPVPIKLSPIDRSRKFSKRKNIKILWNHRWEYDKQPEVFWGAIEKLSDTDIQFELFVVGESFKKIPNCFNQARDRFNSQIRVWGYVEQEQYEGLLKSCDLVVSSALHDFQGLSMLEAITCGCLPIAPNRVAYPEYIPQELLYPVAQQVELESQHLFDKLVQVVKKPPQSKVLVTDYQATQLIPQYFQLVTQTIDRTSFNKR